MNLTHSFPGPLKLKNNGDVPLSQHVSKLLNKYALNLVALSAVYTKMSRLTLILFGIGSI
jgi:hypothetical protein